MLAVAILRLPNLADFSAACFPSPETALHSPQGLLAFGGDLSVERLIAAYQQGIFPWFSQEDPILWWCPDPRAVLPVDQFHLSRSMQRFHRKSPYQVTINHDFSRVITLCAQTHTEGTWITAEVITAWERLAALGLAHSVEVWQAQQLVGGLYGMAIGATFCGESMFSLQPNASKTALMQLCQHFSQFNGKLIDCQILNPHTASLGARDIPRDAYLQQLAANQNRTIAEGCWVKQRIF